MKRITKTRRKDSYPNGKPTGVSAKK